jgi:hypothetical protein
MSKEKEINAVADKLVNKGMKRKLAKKNLLECDRYFIEKLWEIL